MDIRKVKKLIELLESFDVDEIEIHEGDGIGADHPAPRPARGSGAPLSRGAGGHAPRRHASTGRRPGAGWRKWSPKRRAEGQLPPGYAVTSPMVGTFYQGVLSGLEAVRLHRQRVAPGDTLCIIEAMKILNQIESEVAGEVKAIIAENGHPVEYGEPLFVIDTGRMTPLRPVESGRDLRPMTLRRRPPHDDRTAAPGRC